MKSYCASIEFISSKLSLAQICAAVGKDATPDSYNMGDPRGSGISKVTNLRFYSDAPEDASLLDHFSDARSKFGESTTTFTNEIERMVSLAVFFDTPLASFDIPPEIVEWASVNGFQIEITCYPSWKELIKEFEMGS